MNKYTLIVILFVSNLLSQEINSFDIDKFSEEINLIETNETQIDSNIDAESGNIINIKNNFNESVNDKFFGYSYFKKDINIFDNIPTPSNYKLGPGDEIILSLWGENNSRDKFVISKEGLIYYENIGFLNLSNKTLEEAELFLVNELSKIYSTLGDVQNSTNLTLELGKLKSINVFFTGQVSNPGVKVVHPFSDIFVALIQAGGVNIEGSLRKIELIRNNKVVALVDFYNFFSTGANDFSDLRLIDGDIIHVPAIENRVEIEGAILRPGFYEVLQSEDLNNLIKYAAGLTPKASSIVTIDTMLSMNNRKSQDDIISSLNIDLTKDKVSLNNGDLIIVREVGNSSSKVHISGRVKVPGKYSAINMSLKDILDIAGGFDDPIFRKSIRDDNILVIRKDDKSFYGLEFNVPYSESANFQIAPGDQIFVYEKSDYNNLLSISVTGQVNKRGSFQLKKGMTVKDAIDLAEGLTPLGNKEAIIVSEVFTFSNDQGEEVQKTVQVNNATLDFELTDGAIINVLPVENVVRVEGNVYDPGLIVHSGNKSIKKYINLAGGPKPYTLKNKIYVKRANGRIKKVSMFRGLGINVKPGDTIFVPVDPEPTDFDITSFLADLASTLANIAAILVIADNQNN